jgi:hypothetical protein
VTPGVALSGIAQKNKLRRNQMAVKNTVAFGLYSDRPQVEQGICSFLAARFRSEDISVLFPENTGSKDFAREEHEGS